MELKLKEAIKRLEEYKDKREKSEFGDAIRTLLSLASSAITIQGILPKKIEKLNCDISGYSKKYGTVTIGNLCDAIDELIDEIKKLREAEK